MFHHLIEKIPVRLIDNGNISLAASLVKYIIGIFMHHRLIDSTFSTLNILNYIFSLLKYRIWVCNLKPDKELFTKKGFKMRAAYYYYC